MISELTLRYSALRDALAEKIWEGTVTVLALDVVRAASKPEVLKAFSLVRTLYVL